MFFKSFFPRKIWHWELQKILMSYSFGSGKLTILAALLSDDAFSIFDSLVFHVLTIYTGDSLAVVLCAEVVDPPTT